MVTNSNDNMDDLEETRTQWMETEGGPLVTDLYSLLAYSITCFHRKSRYFNFFVN